MSMTLAAHMASSISGRAASSSFCRSLASSLSAWARACCCSRLRCSLSCACRRRRSLQSDALATPSSGCIHVERVAGTGKIPQCSLRMHGGARKCQHTPVQTWHQDLLPEIVLRACNGPAPPGDLGADGANTVPLLQGPQALLREMLGWTLCTGLRWPLLWRPHQPHPASAHAALRFHPSWHPILRPSGSC